MKIKVKPFHELQNPNLWYAEAPGNIYEAWRNDAFPGWFFVDTILFIPGEDIKILKDGSTK